MRMRSLAKAVLVAAGVWMACALGAPPVSAQRMGPPVSGTVPGVRLTQQQRQRIMEIRRSTQQQVQQVQRDPRLSQSEKERRIAQIRQRGHDQVMGVLSSEQRAAFANRWRQRHAVAGYRGGKMQRRAR